MANWESTKISRRKILDERIQKMGFTQTMITKQGEMCWQRGKANKVNADLKHDWLLDRQVQGAYVMV